MSIGNASGTNVPPLSLADADTQRKARRGLAIYLAAVIVLTALFDVLVFTVSPLWISGRSSHRLRPRLWRVWRSARVSPMCLFVSVGAGRGR